MTDLALILDAELTAIEDPVLVHAIRASMIEPRCENYEWDYSENTQYPCWIVAVDPVSKMAIGYCEFGFGPACPWGILLDDAGYRNMGPDSAWYSRLEDAFRQSSMWKGGNAIDCEVP